MNKVNGGRVGQGRLVLLGSKTYTQQCGIGAILDKMAQENRLIHIMVLINERGSVSKNGKRWTINKDKIKIRYLHYNIWKN